MTVVARTAARRARAATYVTRAAVLGARHASPSQVFAGADDATWSWLHLHGAERFPTVARLLPSLPNDVIQARFTGSSGRQTLLEGFRFWQLVRDQADAHLDGLVGRDVLDFGCGWGRILRFFVKDVPPSHLWATDVVDNMVAFTARSNPWAVVTVGPALPPLDRAAESLDLVYLYSVFSHLSEETHHAWRQEFHRVLRPGGLVVATTWQRDFIQWCADARAGLPSPVHHASGLAAFEDTAAWLAAYDAGRFCHSPIGTSATLDASFYGETCIPAAFVERHWADEWDVVDYVSDPLRCPQNVFVARRR